jgi:hypothetical protein
MHWLKTISSRTGGAVEEEILELGEQKRWKLVRQQQHCTITLQSPYHYALGENKILKRYLCLQEYFLSITTSSLELLDLFVKLNQYPYECIQWRLPKSLDITTIIEQIYKRAGRKPSREWCLKPSGLRKCDSSEDVTYHIHHEELTITIVLAPQQGAEPAKIALLHSPGRGMGGVVFGSRVGFYRAHELFSPRRILSILRNELPPQHFAQVIEDSCAGSSPILLPDLDLGDDWEFPLKQILPHLVDLSYLYES